jgi:hypothetical protein
MKITVAQLKQLIREQIEEGASPYGRSENDRYGTSPGETSGAAHRRTNAAWEAQLDQTKAREDAEQAKRDLASAGARYEREQFNREYLKNQEADRKWAEGADERKWADEFKDAGTDTGKAAEIYWGLTKDDQFNLSYKAPKTYEKYITPWIGKKKHNKVTTPKGKRTDPETGKKYYIAGVDDKKKGLLGLGFMGLEEEIQQMVKEEVARQLRNKR